MAYLIAAVLLIVILVNAWPSFGGFPDRAARHRIFRSPNHHRGVFRNLERTRTDVPPAAMFEIMFDMMRGFRRDIPDHPIENLPFDSEDFSAREDGFYYAWFGHSSVILNLRGYIILADPVFSRNASPFPFIGPRRFPLKHPIAPDQMPDIDLMLISHDHYDHLDYSAVRALDSRVRRYAVPLGVEAHLKRWGVLSEKISVHDWWDGDSVAPGIRITAVPSRHNSGRGLLDGIKTLWTSWVIEAGGRRIFFSGDTGYGRHFSAIGRRFGPFDLTFIECGQYHGHWADVHSTPEQTVQAHQDLGGRRLVPIHWSAFMLSLHPWDEPPARAKAEAKKKGVSVETPLIGEIVSF